MSGQHAEGHFTYLPHSALRRAKGDRKWKTIEGLIIYLTAQLTGLVAWFKDLPTARLQVSMLRIQGNRAYDTHPLKDDRTHNYELGSAE